MNFVITDISTTPTTDVNPRRASERIKMQGTPRHCSSVVQIHTLTEALTGQQADRQAKRQLDYVYAPEDLSAGKLNCIVT